MPPPRLETDDVNYMREQFEAWMDGARARARGIPFQSIPYPARTRKGDAWENGWEVVDLELRGAEFRKRHEANRALDALINDE